MRELEITTGRLAQVWWRMVWSGVLAVLGGIILFSVAGGVVLELAKLLFFHWSADEMHEVNRKFGLVAVAPIIVLANAVAIRMAFRNKYKDFRIALLESE